MIKRTINLEVEVLSSTYPLPETFSFEDYLVAKAIQLGHGKHTIHFKRMSSPEDIDFQSLIDINVKMNVL